MGNENAVIPASGAPAVSRAALTIAITSGKGGVGKTNIAANLGIALAGAGKRVCVFDADTSLANINILLKVTPEITLEHFLRGEQPIERVMLAGPRGVQIIPAASGISDYLQLSLIQQRKLVAGLEKLERQFDFILIDTAAGIDETVIRFIESAHHVVVVITSEPTSLTDAFSLIKVLRRRGHDRPVHILVNMAANYAHSKEVYKRFADAVKKYIQTTVSYLGYIPMDKAVPRAVSAQSPLVVSYPTSPAANCIELLAKTVLEDLATDIFPVRNMSRFWRSQSKRIDAPAPEAEPPANTTTWPLPPLSPLGARIESFAESLANAGPTQEQVDELLVDLIDFYLREFGVVPKTVADARLITDTRETSPPTPRGGDAQRPPQAVAGVEVHGSQPDASLVDRIQSRLDMLVAETELSKKQLTGLAGAQLPALAEKQLYELVERLRQEYRRLCNADVPGGGQENPAHTRSDPGDPLIE